MSENEDAIRELYDDLAEAGVATVTIEWNGSGDEGYVEDVQYIHADGETRVEVDHDFDRTLQDVVMSYVDATWSGWEINEGGGGSAFIDVANRETKIETYEYVQTREDHEPVIL